MPQSTQSPYTHVWSDDDLPHAFALASNTNHSKLPVDAQVWLQTQISGNHLVILDALHEKPNIEMLIVGVILSGIWREIGSHLYTQRLRKEKSIN